ncbi:MAG: hypothetical protein WBQ25_03835 [Nitrososphaeraceae archaeon]
MTVAVIVTILALALVVSSPANNVNARKGYRSCFQQGINDGLNYPFNQNTFDICGSPYEKGFMKGCLSVEGNTVDTCNSAEDAG